MKENTSQQVQLRPVQWLLAILLLFTFAALAVTITLRCRGLYESDLAEQDLPATTGLSKEFILTQYDALISYNLPGGPKELSFPDLPASPNGLYHFEEVKRIFMVFQIGLPIALLLSVAGIILLRKTKLLCLKYATFLALGIPALLGTGAILFWDQFFVLFHEMVFANDYWIFSASTDPIIMLLPDVYFMHCALLILAIVLGCGVISLLIYRILYVVRKRSGAKAPIGV
ncbi:MAG: TIGR01906 family membrane protein [Clostridium sp.]|jgi:integral membrane protein (TIGR01906 family)|nr:TIGR01906 family membrane protein [Clostridium sp.]